MTGRVAGKVALVTGAARGLGAAQARALAAEGARVVLTDVLDSAGREVAAEIGAAATYTRHDVADSAAWAAAIEAAERHFGLVSILVNNAGIVHNEPIETLSEHDYRKVIDVNQVGVFLGMKAVLPSMRRAGGGSIVNISSIAGIVAFAHVLGYVASKWAVRGMTKAAAHEFGKYGIRVNSVHPGIVPTDMNRNTADMLGQPIARPATPDEVARLVLFLASDESSYATGAEYTLDGGYTAM